MKNLLLAAAFLCFTGNPTFAQQEQAYRIDKNGSGYRVQYPSGNFTDVMPCGNDLCITSTSPSLPPPPILPVGRLDPFAEPRIDPYSNPLQ